MSNHKFFSGLPDTWMKNRATGPNRQQTNFFWPDEKEKEEQVSLPRRSRTRKSSDAGMSDYSGRSTDTEELKRRHCEQMKSKIEFYDMVDTKVDSKTPSDSRTSNSQNAAKSRIEFYDYADEKKVQNGNEKKIHKKEEKEVFIEIKQENGDSFPKNRQNKEILRENGNSKKEQIPNSPKWVDRSPPSVSPKRERSDKRKKQPDLEENMRNLNLNIDNTQEKTRKNSKPVDSYSESDDGLEDYQYQKKYSQQSQTQKTKIPRTPTSPEDLDFDADYRYYEKNRRAKYRQSRQEPSVRGRPASRKHSSEMSDEEHYDFDDEEDYQQRCIDFLERQRSPARKPPTPKYEEDYYSKPPAVPKTGRYHHVNDDDNFEDYRQKNVRNITGNNKKTSLTHKISIDSDDMNYNKRPASQRSRSPAGSVTSEAKHRYHVNLKSNIFHNNTDYLENVSQRRPSTVRNSATNRVGVGLPDF